MRHLKKFQTILIFSLIIVFASCKNNNETEPGNIQLLTDSSAYNNDISTDTSKVTQSEVIPKEAKVSHEAVSSKVTHKTATENQPAPVSDTATVTTGNSGPAANADTTSSEGTVETPAAKKKGWSKAAQGAVIGGVGGAIGGAIISKKKGTGAAIGGAVGAAGGYIIGRQKDKKDGRAK